MIDVTDKTYNKLSKMMTFNSQFRDEVLSATQFLDDGASNMQRLWHVKNKIYEIPKCKQCNAEVEYSKQGGKNRGYNNYCSDSCRQTYQNLNRSMEERIARKEKIKQTCLERYGVEHFFSAEEVMSKKKSVYQSRYGVDNPSQLDWVRDKVKETILKNYGVENPSQSHEVQAKKTLKSKNKQFITECGKVYNLEGYEVVALEELLKLHKPSDVLHHKELEDELGRIRYEFNNKTSIYHPDFYVKSVNKIVEVKSLYWYEKALDRNTAKRNACVDLGYSFEFWIYDPKKEMSKTIK